MQVGKYRHFKGGIYEVIKVAKHFETEEEYAVYVCPKGEVWIKNANLFNPPMEKDGKTIYRFEYIGE